jgi:GTP cyclohydrolase II
MSENDNPKSATGSRHKGMPHPAAPCVRAAVRVPLRAGGQMGDAVTMATFDGLCDGLEHIAVLFGDPRATPGPLVRLHSECLTGDVFESARCDCGPQLRDSIRIMREQGGIILYLRQEGRGIGLYNKIDAYLLQDNLGLDTFEANRALHFADDHRDYQGAAQMLAALGTTRIKLLSNNPDKKAQLSAHGIDVVAQLRTGVFLTGANRSYLRAKVQLAGHLIDLDRRTRK